MNNRHATNFSTSINDSIKISFIRLHRFDETKEFSVTISKFNDHYLANFHEEMREERFREINDALKDAMFLGYKFDTTSVFAKRI